MRRQRISNAILLQAGNLAHSLKTPLALLHFEGQRLEAAGLDGRCIIEHCDRIQRQINYQLARSRAAASRFGSASGSRLGQVSTP